MRAKSDIVQAYLGCSTQDREDIQTCLRQCTETLVSHLIEPILEVLRTNPGSRCQETLGKIRNQDEQFRMIWRSMVNQAYQQSGLIDSGRETLAQSYYTLQNKLHDLITVLNHKMGEVSQPSTSRDKEKYLYFDEQPSNAFLGQESKPGPLPSQPAPQQPPARGMEAGRNPSFGQFPGNPPAPSLSPTPVRPSAPASPIPAANTPQTPERVRRLPFPPASTHSASTTLYPGTGGLVYTPTKDNNPNNPNNNGTNNSTTVQNSAAANRNTQNTSFSANKDPKLALVRKLRDKYSACIREHVQTESKPWLVAVSKHVGRVFYAGHGLGYMSFVRGNLKDQGIVWQKRITFVRDIGSERFCAGFCLNLGLGVYTDMFDHLAYLPGAIKTSRDEQDDTTVRWQLGSADHTMFSPWIFDYPSVGILNHKTLEVATYPEFFSLVGVDSPQPISCITSADGTRICGLARHSLRKFTLHIANKSGTAQTFRMEDFLQGDYEWTCIENNFENDLLILGGSHIPTGRAVLMGVTVKQPFARSFVYHFERDSGYMGITAIRRHSDANIFFLGTTRHLLIVYLAEKTVYLLNQFTLNPCDKPVSDLCILENDVWLVNESQVVFGFHFGTDITQREIAKRIPPPPKDVLDLDRFYIRQKNYDSPDGAAGMIGIDPATGERFSDASSMKQDGNRFGDLGNNPDSQNDPARLLQMIKSGQPKLYPKYSKVFGRFMLRTHNLPGLFPVSLSAAGPSAVYVAASSCVRLLTKAPEGYRFVQRASGDIYATTQKIHEIITVTGDLVTLEGSEVLRVEAATGTVVGRLKAEAGSDWIANKPNDKREWGLSGHLPYSGIYAGCKTAYVWNKMDSDAGILHLEAMSEVPIAKFFENSGSNDFYPLCAIISPITRNLIGSVVDSTGKHILVFSDRLKTDRTPQKEILGNHGFVTRMEVSLDDRVFFAGGAGQDLTSSVTSAKLFCLTFQARPIMLEMIELRSNKGAPLGPVSCLRRYPDKQVLIAAAKNTIWAVEWTGNCFSILSTVEDIHGGFISSVEMLESEQKIFTCSPIDSHITEITYLT